ncbi:MAG: DUF2520 domain-containing protein, partial [Candidatus Tectomicrobia bacterium]|nr:DUF2520 domain-containing protein [Candidatus Tectomicrobia bacterium]
MPTKAFSIIGAGTVGTAIGCLLARQGYQPVGVASRRLVSARRAAQRMGAQAYSTIPADVVQRSRYVFIATPDRAISQVAQTLLASGRLARGALLAHFSGAHSWRILGPCRQAGIHGASLHPLYTFPDVDAAIESMKSVWFTVEGDPGGVRLARPLVRALGGKILNLPETLPKPLYHGAASSASNFLVTLISYSIRILESGGLGHKEALRALFPLIRATLDNVERLGPAGALTGPIARGDVETVAAQLQALDQHAPELAPLFRALASYTVRVAQEKG